MGSSQPALSRAGADGWSVLGTPISPVMLKKQMVPQLWPRDQWFHSESLYSSWFWTNTIYRSLMSLIPQIPKQQRCSSITIKRGLWNLCRHAPPYSSQPTELCCNLLIPGCIQLPMSSHWSWVWESRRIAVSHTWGNSRTNGSKTSGAAPQIPKWFYSLHDFTILPFTKCLCFA